MASTGDWIIKGVQGEPYPCKPDIFEATYEKVGLIKLPGRSVGKTTEMPGYHEALADLSDGSRMAASQEVEEAATIRIGKDGSVLVTVEGKPLECLSQVILVANSEDPQPFLQIRQTKEYLALDAENVWPQKPETPTPKEK